MADRIVQVDGVTVGYATLAAAHATEVALGGDLTARLGAPARLIFEITSTAEDVSAPTIGAGFTSGTVIVRAAAGNMAGTDWDASRYRIRNPSTATSAITVDTSGGCNVGIYGLQTECRKISGSSQMYNVNIASGAVGTVVTVEGCYCLVTATGASGPQGGIYGGSGVVTYRFGNNIVHGTGVTAAAVSFTTVASSTPAYVYNVSSFGMLYAVDARSTGRVRAKNVLAANSRTSGFTGTFHADSSNCLSTDASVPAVGTGHRASAVVTFVDAAGFDLALATSDTGAKGYGAYLAGDAGYPINNDIRRTERGAIWDIGAHQATVEAAIVADRINITTQPATAVNVGDTITVVAAAQNAGGVTQADYSASAVWQLLASAAPTGWDLATVLDTDSPAAGVVAMTFTVPMEGEWRFRVHDTAASLTDSAASSTVTATLTTGGGGGTTIITSGGALADMDLLKGGSGARRTLIYQATDVTTGAPVASLTGKPSISVNGAAPSTTPAAANAAHTGGGYYRVEVADASIAAGDDVVVTAHSTARITSTVGRVTLTDVGAAAASTSDTAAAVAAHADVQAIKAASQGVRTDVTTARAAKLDQLDAPVSGVAAVLLDLPNGVEAGVTLRQSLRAMLSGMAAKLTGASTTTVRVRDVGDTKDRITATVDEHGNRSAVTLDLS